MTGSIEAMSSDAYWSEAWKVGFGPMDDTHREMVDLLDTVRDCSDAALAGCMDRLLVHLIDHFATEDTWMRQTDFPPRDCHMDEHARVLESGREAQALLAQGNIEVGRSFAAALVEWFPRHTSHLDSALAHWIIRQRHGAKPIVMRARQNV